MSEIDRLKRMQGLRPSQPESLAPVPSIVTIQHCLLRQDGIATSVIDGTGAGSQIGSMSISPAAVIAGPSVLQQWPGPGMQGISVTAGGFVIDNSRFFKPGWWVFNVMIMAASVSAVPTLRIRWLPKDAISGVLTDRPFIGAQAPTAPIVQFRASTARDWTLAFSAFFPEAWAMQWEVPSGGDLQTTSTYHIAGTITLDCGLDDIPAALSSKYYP